MQVKKQGNNAAVTSPRANMVRKLQFNPGTKARELVRIQKETGTNEPRSQVEPVRY